VKTATQQTIEQALSDRKIIRTWPMRGTLHFVAPADVRWMLALLTPRIMARAGQRHRQLELDDATFARAETLFASALEGGRQLPRHEMLAVLEQAGIATAGQRGYHILWWTAQKGLICFGPRQGNQDTFVLLDDWLPAGSPLNRAEALAELARRYFTGHGPATIQDFRWWSGLAAADAQAGLEMIEAQLGSEVIEGQTYWFSSALPAPPAAAYLLPGFDEYLLGYRDRSAVLMLVIDGRVVGTWKRTMRRTKVVVSFDPFEPLRSAQTEAAVLAAEPYGRFLGLPVEISRVN
jgi:hypothetical protein